MRGYRRFASAGQMMVGLGVFAVLALVLDSAGLYSWAQRLDVGPERTVAMPVVSALHWGLRSLGLERLRQVELAKLARAGWSDDPAGADRAYGTVTEDVMPLAPPPAKSGTAALIAEAVEPATTAVNVPHTPMLPLTPMAGDPPILSALPAIAPVREGKMRTVALVGDSMMAVGLSSTMLREAPRYKDLTVLQVYKSGTGLARPEVFDWQREYPVMLRDAKPDVIVVAIGANDGQGFVEGGVTYPFGTTQWQAIYQRRVEAFLTLLESNGATVIWVGLPPMKSGTYNARIALVNRIDYAVVKASTQASWFSSAGLVGDSSGQFQDYGEVRGTTARLRQPDGIHLSDDGAELLAAKLLPWLAKQEPTKQAAEPVVKDAGGEADGEPSRAALNVEPVRRRTWKRTGPPFLARESVAGALVLEITQQKALWICG